MQGRRQLGWFLIVLLIILVAPLGPQPLAEVASPYRAQMSLERVYEVGRSRSRAKEIETIPSVRVRGRIKNVGFVDARFNIRKNKTWRASVRDNGAERDDSIDPVLLQGKLAVGGSWRQSGQRMMPSAASVIGDELKVSFPGKTKGKRKTRQRIYTVRMKLDGSIVVTARVSSIPRSAGKRGACGAAVGAASLGESSAAGVIAAHSGEGTGGESDGDEPIPPVTDPNANQPLARVVTISTDADPEWYQRYGEQSNAVIASIINTAEALYNSQLGLRFRIVRQHVYSDASPYVTADPGGLLTAFTRNPDNASNLGDDPNSFHDDVDLKHLFTGKDLMGDVIGIAYIGVVCAVPTLSYGITQHYIDVANPGIFAHELGHNFGAFHDSSDRGGMMYPSISIPPAQRFSNASLEEIVGHVTKYGSCISLESMAPRPDITPAPDPFGPTPGGPGLRSAQLKLRRARVEGPRGPLVRLSGTLKSAAGTPLGAVGIRLMIAGEEVGATATSSRGAFEFFLKIDIPRSQKVYVYVETEGGEIFSNFLWLGRTRSR